MSTTWYGARSICEYCRDAATSVEIRVVASSMSFISSSVSTVPCSQCMIAPNAAAGTAAAAWSSHSRSMPAETKAGARSHPSVKSCSSNQSPIWSSRSAASNGPSGVGRRHAIHGIVLEGGQGLQRGRVLGSGRDDPEVVTQRLEPLAQ